MLYSLIIRFPDLDPMLRPIVLKLESMKEKKIEVRDF